MRKRARACVRANFVKLTFSGGGRDDRGSSSTAACAIKAHALERAHTRTRMGAAHSKQPPLACARLADQWSMTRYACRTSMLGGDVRRSTTSCRHAHSCSCELVDHLLVCACVCGSIHAWHTHTRTASIPFGSAERLIPCAHLYVGLESVFYSSSFFLRCSMCVCVCTHETFSQYPIGPMIGSASQPTFHWFDVLGAVCSDCLCVCAPSGLKFGCLPPPPPVAAPAGMCVKSINGKYL